MKKKILVVDDEKTMQSILRAMLHPDYEVVSAVDALQGVAMARQTKPDLIILDLHMPAGGGESVYERLKNLNDTWQIPVLLCTSDALDQAQAKVPGVPPENILTKPVAVKTLREAISRLLPG